jgi:hypothetical protein
MGSAFAHPRRSKRGGATREPRGGVHRSHTRISHKAIEGRVTELTP